MTNDRQYSTSTDLRMVCKVFCKNKDNKIDLELAQISLSEKEKAKKMFVCRMGGFWLRPFINKTKRHDHKYLPLPLFYHFKKRAYLNVTAKRLNNICTEF